MANQNDNGKNIYCHTAQNADIGVHALIALSESIGGPSVIFQKRDRSLRNALYTILAMEPAVTVSIHGASSILEYSSGEVESANIDACPFDFLSNLAEKLSVDTLVRKSLKNLPDVDFVSGLIGYFGPALTGLIENIEKQEHDPFKVPDACLLVPQTVIYVDHARNEVHIISSKGKERTDDVVNRLQVFKQETRVPSQPSDSVFELKSAMTKEQFLAKVKEAKSFIEEGQCFQIVISQRFFAQTDVSATQLFSTLIETAPSTYNYLLNFQDFQYVGASPETMVSVKADQVRLCALAGTRPRGLTIDQDLKNEVELQNNEKELAEHFMLVDLGRNDLGKVCIAGTIQVGPIAQVLRYSNVMHLGTEIFGKLRTDRTPLSALKACFPRGTVSGAPKVRALELLSKLEPEQRGIYSGAVGFLDARGTLETAIAIRSALLKEGVVHINAGAGIVYDSQPEFEYQETINKSSAIAQVLRQASGQSAAHAVHAPSFSPRQLRTGAGR